MYISCLYNTYKNTLLLHKKLNNYLFKPLLNHLSIIIITNAIKVFLNIHKYIIGVSKC